MKKNDPRKMAWEILARVEEGMFSDLALDAALSNASQLEDRDRALLTELVYGVLRYRGRLDFALSHCCSQPLRKVEPAVLRLLRLGCYQILLLDRIPVRAAVHETVELAKRLGLSRATGFVNGILRAVDRRRESIPWPDPRKAPLAHLQHVLSLPKWLAQTWLKEFGAAEALALAEAMLQVAPFTVRVNSLQQGREEFLAALTDAGYQAMATAYAPEGISIEGGGSRRLPGDDRGAYQLQDQASMLIAHLLAPQPGERLLDACAAPGGKTTHLAALADNRAEIMALDISAARLALVEQSALRLGTQGISCRAWDLTAAPDFLKNGSFDGILVDAPCSGLGTLRRNPESRWRRQPADLAVNAERQLAILSRAAPLLRTGGRLVYSLCTFTQEETEGVVQKFLAAYPEFERIDLRLQVPEAWRELFDEQGALRTWPHHHGGMDAFFAVGFRRKA
ncbi:16S rRNA (cytosine(967)-C(5))-methyltransferase [Syntrophotalea acetylenivorans]|uniref:16S rRNA (cytosine(967)-C(5))-methyltransferase n=1 Tax=Syntrophotalea acetylenivorans TaxID=1842532 RepID=A0A1L3GQT7_9BACT|nr:16S rRNA (cytosine(967)-C(5))-methyltransferase RsmB [Syntrophotalea acetylenivorans]APG28309.1 16S rRNA (cytosine(967)-C(5))-methyltransferase [Syntrophotalea acetylenivorans]